MERVTAKSENQAIPYNKKSYNVLSCDLGRHCVREDLVSSSGSPVGRVL